MVSRIVISRIKLSALLFAILGVSSCSSSNSGITLPETEVDSAPPKIRSFQPFVDEGEPVPSNSRFVARYDEVLDVSTLPDNVTLSSVKARDIFSGVDVSPEDGSIYEQDSRELDLVITDELFTAEIVEVVRETFDEDDVPIQETRTIIKEVNSSVITIEPISRLALWSSYVLDFGEGIKDISPVRTISPLDGTETTGNFAEPFRVSFSVADGSWRHIDTVNTDFLASQNFVGDASFVSMSDVGYAIWRQDDIGTGESAMYLRAFNQESQSLSGESMRVDYISSIDGPNSIPAQVISFSSDSLASSQCITWVVQESITIQSVYYRCGKDNMFFDRKALISHSFDSAIGGLSLVIAKGGSVYISYHYDGDFYVYALSELEGGSTPAVLDSSVFGLDNKEVLSSSVVTHFVEGFPTLHAVLSVMDNTASADKRYAADHLSFDFDGDRLLFTERNIGYSGTLIKDVSVGMDFLGRGVAAWHTDGSAGPGGYTSVFNTVTWSSPIRAQSQTYGAVSASSLFVFEDGQSIFSWVEEGANGSIIKVQGIFPVDGNSGLVRPSTIELYSSSDTISDLTVQGDREGNGFVMFRSGSGLFSTRFRQNLPWDAAWGAAQIISSNVQEGATLFPIKEDGRAVVLFVDDNATYTSLLLRVFSDFD